MAYNKEYLFGKAIEITKKYARSGHSSSVAFVLKAVYQQLVELNEDLKKEDN